MESLLILISEYKFFLYGIMTWFVIHFFEKEKFTERTLMKFIVFWFLMQFAHIATTGYPKTGDLNEEYHLMISVWVSTALYIFLLKAMSPEWKEAIGGGLFNLFMKKTNIETKKISSKK